MLVSLGVSRESGGGRKGSDVHSCSADAYEQLSCSVRLLFSGKANVHGMAALASKQKQTRALSDKCFQNLYA